MEASIIIETGFEPAADTFVLDPVDLVGYTPIPDGPWGGPWGPWPIPFPFPLPDPWPTPCPVCDEFQLDAAVVIEDGFDLGL